ncbi:MAG: hypothetical protein ACOY5F_13215 [Pseudomonadota bacterium]
MQSECARVTTAAEARFRVDAPNSRPRSIPVIALDAGCERVLKALREEGSEAAFFGVSSGGDDAAATRTVKGALRDIATGTAKDLAEVLMSADHVVLVVTAGEDAEIAPIIGEACNAFRVPATALVLGSSEVTEEALSKTASRFRAWVAMLVIANTEDYVLPMLSALRA